MLDAEFFPQFEEILAACSHPKLQKAVFSATLPANAEKMAMQMLRDPIRVVVGLKCALDFFLTSLLGLTGLCAETPPSRSFPSRSPMSQTTPPSYPVS